MAGGHAFAWLTAGASHTCGLTTTGTVLCWGRNDAGELGDGSTTDRGVPTAIASVAGGNAFIRLSAGDRHTCGVVSAGGATPVAVYRVYCWGSNDAGQLRTFTGAFSPTPVVSVDRQLAERPLSVASGGSHSCAIYSPASNPDCWGSNSAGQHGSGFSTPYTIYSALAAGGEHTCGITERVLTCWGSNASGQLGNPAGGGGTPVTVTVPGHPLVQVDGGRAFTCARQTSISVTYGFAYCWGSDAEGQLGNGAAAGSSPTPVRVP